MDKAYVFDKARFHLESVREAGLEDHQAYVHGGLFFGWAVARGLVLPWVETIAPAAFAAFRRGEISGPVLFAACDGALLDDLFTDEGLAFVAEYYPFRTGAYLGDYTRTLVAGLPSEFHVEDTRENADKLGVVLDERLAAFRVGWDQARGRPDLRADGPAPAAWPERLTLPVIAVTSGVPLPHGSLGIRAGRAESVAAVVAALAGDRRVALVPTAEPGRRGQVHPDELLDVGIAAELETVTVPPDQPAARDLVLACVARVQLDGVPVLGADGALRVGARVLADPEPTDEDLGKLDELRARAAAIVRRRIDLGDPPGSLVLAAAAPPAALPDLVARSLPATRDELLTVLIAPDLATRLAVVEDLVGREPG